MPNKDIRERKEIDNLFRDPKYCRQAWRNIGTAILQSPVSRMPVDYDKDGNPTLRSSLEDYSYRSLKRDITALCKRDGLEEREPTELEMIMQCQIAKARFDTNAAIFVRDTLGAKPVDESKIDATLSNPYEELTDEELALLAAHRAGNQPSLEQPTASEQASPASARASHHHCDTPETPTPTDCNDTWVADSNETPVPRDISQTVEQVHGDHTETSVHDAKAWIKRREWEQTRDTSSVEQMRNVATDTPPSSSASHHIAAQEDER